MDITHSDAARFWAKVDVRGPDECWLWTAATQRGYGAFRIGKKGNRHQVNANRVAYAIANGGLIPDSHVMHSCDTPLCCNALHLVAGTRSDNMSDAGKKGHLSSSASRARLSTEQIEEIRKAYLAGFPIRHIARANRCAPVTVRKYVVDLRVEPRGSASRHGEMGVPLGIPHADQP